MENPFEMFGVITTILVLLFGAAAVGYSYGNDSGFLDGKCDAIYGTGSVWEYNKCLTPVK